MTARAPVQDTELGRERLCTRCGEWWPLDEEFWYFRDRAGRRDVLPPCRACWSDRKRNQRARRAV